MKALILCAGLGTRLQPITDFMPKCMVEINGKPVLQHLIEYLNRYEVTDIIVNIHSFPEQVITKFPNVLFFYEKVPLGEAVTESLLAPWLGNKYLVLNGDTLTDLPLEKLMGYTHSVKSMDCGVYTGQKLVVKDTEPGEADFTAWWQDMGTFSGLAKTINHYS
jgi:NDP-sugar pyrophosphorylase family protein